MGVLEIVLIVLLILILIGAVGGYPYWAPGNPYGWGFAPAGFLGLLLVVILIVLLIRLL